MMKKLIIAILLIIGSFAIAEKSFAQDTTGAYLYGRMFIGKPGTPYGGVYGKTGYFNALYLNNTLISAFLDAKQDTNYVLSNIETYIANLLASKQDTSSVSSDIVLWLASKQDTSSILTNIDDWLAKKQDTSSTLVLWADTTTIATRVFVTNYVDTSKVINWADTATIATRSYVNNRVTDTTNILFWSDTTSGLATKIYVDNKAALKLNYNDTTRTKALYSTVTDITDNGDTGKDTIDARQSNNFTKDSIGVSKTLTVNNITDGQVLNISLGVTGSYTITFDFPGLTLKYPGGTTPTQTVTNGKIDMWTFVRHGLTVYGNAVQNF